VNRRDFIKTTGAAALLGAAHPSGGGDAQPPNLVIIHTDEHNFRTLGCYRDTLPPEQALMWGEAVVETPNIDWLAEEGALCTSFYATTPVCSPSRAAFVSGRYPQNTAVTTNDIPMDDGIVTFAEILGRQGYATGYAGKWHLDGTGKPQWEPERGFGFEDNRYMFNRGHWKQLEETRDGPRVKARNAKGEPNYDVKGADEQSFTTDFLADRAVDFIDEHSDEPFCFMVSIPDPHGPDTVRPPYDTMFADQTYTQPRTYERPAHGVPRWGRGNEKFLDMASYYGMVRCIDDNVGKILEALRERGVLDNTIVVFTADHGDLRGEHRRQNKGVPYEGSAKVPFIIRAPGAVEPGTVVHEALGCVDFLPTIISLMGFETAGKEEGRDASQLIATGQAPAGWTDISFMRSTGKPGATNGWLAAITQRYKLVVSTVDDPWLFDLEDDPDELVNFFGHPAYRRIAHELSAALLDYGRTHGDPYVELPGIKTDLAEAAG